MRFAVPRWVFSFGIGVTPYYYAQVFTGELWCLIDNPDFGQSLGNSLQKLVAQFLVRHLATSEEDHDLHLVALLQKAADFAKLDFKIVRAYFETQSHLLHLRGFGIFTISLQFLHLLVIVFTPVDNANHRWVGAW